MKNISVMIIVVILVAILGLTLFSFQVRQTEKALVMQFGKHVRTIKEPGWHFKWPVPIQVVYKFDSRSHLYQRKIEETTTAGGDSIIVTSYVVWRVGDPLKFYQSVVDQPAAEKKLGDLLGGSQNTTIGKYAFSDFVNSDPTLIRFEKIESDMLASIQPKAAELGIDVQTAGIKQLAIPEKATQQVFDRMKAERQQKTDAILKEGDATAKKITSDAESKRTELLAVVEAQAKAIRGQGDAEAAKYYQMLDADPQLAIFLRDIDALKKVLKERTTIVLGADSDPIQLLKKIPDLKPAAPTAAAPAAK
jgi:modulator of FtsH protease HflC